MSLSDPIRIGHPMRPWQRECANLSVGKRFLVLVLHRRAGKTELALKKLCNAALKNTLDLPHYAYVAPLLKQAKTIAWARLKQMVAPFGPHVEINESELIVKFRPNGAVIRVLGADNPDSLRGVRLDGAVIDEVAQVKPEVWEEIIRPALSDRRGWAWFLGTPKGINLFSALYFGAEDWEDWASARYTVYDTDALPADEVEQLRLEMSEQAFAREFLCDFRAAGDDQLLSLNDVEAASRIEYKPGAMDYAPKILGVDPARFGNDRSVIVPRQGLQVFKPMVYRGLDNMELANRVALKIEQWQPDAVFVDAGAGAGVIDRLRQLGHSVVEVNFGGRASDQRYVNKRTEMWFEMAESVRAGLSIPNDNALKLELATPFYKFDSQNRLALESKDDIKKRMPEGASPDIADALALTYAFPVAKRDTIALAKKPKEYDPYASLRN
jgi:hypothetical protein